MNAALQARVRHILLREFYRRGRLTWDMKMALRRALQRPDPPDYSLFPEIIAFDSHPLSPHIPNRFQGRAVQKDRENITAAAVNSAETWQ